MHLRSHPKFAQMGWTRISRIRWKSDGVSMRADDSRVILSLRRNVVVAVRCQMMTTGGNVDHITVGDCRKGGCKKARLTSPTALSSTDSQRSAPRCWIHHEPGSDSDCS